MIGEEERIVKALQKTGVCTVHHSWETEEKPDLWFVFRVWKMFGENDLHLYYNYISHKYHFFIKSAEGQVKLSKKGCYDKYNVRKLIDTEFGHLIAYAKTIVKTLLAGQLFFVKDIDQIKRIEDDFDALVAFVGWYSDGQFDESNAGLKSDGEHPYFIVGDPDQALKKLKRMGYRTVTAFDEEGNEDSYVWLLDADFGYRQFYWEDHQERIENFIMESLQSEFGDCIYNSNYDEEQRMWIYELDLGDQYESRLKRFVKSWNSTKPYGIRCKQGQLVPIGFVLLFKNGYKYSK